MEDEAMKKTYFILEVAVARMYFYNKQIEACSLFKVLIDLRTKTIKIQNRQSKFRKEVGHVFYSDKVASPHWFSAFSKDPDKHAASFLD